MNLALAKWTRLITSGCEVLGCYNVPIQPRICGLGACTCSFCPICLSVCLHKSFNIAPNFYISK